MTELAPPPRVARVLLATLLPRALRDDVVSNLDDLYTRHARRRGPLGANLWYWRQAISFPARLWVAGDRPATLTFTTRTSIMRSIVQDLQYAYRLH